MKKINNLEKNINESFLAKRSLLNSEIKIKKAISVIFQKPLFRLDLIMGPGYVFEHLKFPKFHDPSIQNELILT